jgi:hypothetical protein
VRARIGGEDKPFLEKNADTVGHGNSVAGVASARAKKS